MASLTRTKLYKVESKSAKTGVKTYRHSIFLEKGFVEDSSFPFTKTFEDICKENNDFGKMGLQHRSILRASTLEFL
jgi:hypothetical protein